MKTQYDNEQDYFLPYHWLIKRNDFYNGGVEYFGYLEIIKRIIFDKFKNRRGYHLDIGCGDGKALDFIVSNTNLKSTGIDLSNRAVNFAKMMCRSKVHTFRVQNLFEIEDKYDLITAIEVLEHIEKDELNLFVRKISMLLDTYGYFICSVPHVQHFSSSSLKKVLLKNGFNNVEMIFQHNMKYDFRFTKNKLWKAIFKLLKNKYFTITIFEKYLCNKYFQKWNIVKSEREAGRLICIAQK